MSYLFLLLPETFSFQMTFLFRYNKLSSATATTKQTLGAAGERTSIAFKNFGNATAKKWNDIRYVYCLVVHIS